MAICPGFAKQRCHEKVCILDGDTIVVGEEHIRIANIDAPEIHHFKCDAERRLAILARQRLEALLSDGTFKIARGDPDTGRVKDRFGRTLATISVGEEDVGDILISEDLVRPWIGRRQPWCSNGSK
ncbi:hypothetical protein PPNSA23_39840 [Phyllobacterium phragmitis]|uniref:TNase-like domain-containing protein n=1 Tax=Phyllobacterium phragmitis TaxID=2670329 RepID=A0ABQ0H559_9HYPH